MRTIVLLFALAACFAAVGCKGQPLEFKETGAVVPALRASLDIRYHKGTGWDHPAPPGTQRAEDRENGVATVGGGILFRFFGDFSFRSITDEDDVDPSNFARVDNVDFPGGSTISGNFDISRETFGWAFGFFTNGFTFGGGVGLLVNGLQLSGEVDADLTTATASPSTNLWGYGLKFYLEGCPHLPPIRIYWDVTVWWAHQGEGWFNGSDTEFGVRGQFRGFNLFAGYRVENFSGELRDGITGESRLLFDLNGLIIGAGVAF
jgi:hypothetical protein